MLGLPRWSRWSWTHGSQLGVLLVLLVLGYIGMMALSSHGTGEGASMDVGSELHAVHADGHIAAAPMSCPAGAGDCMLAWARPKAETTTAVVAPLVVTGLHILLDGSRSLAPSSYALSPPRTVSAQALLQVFRM